MQFSPTTKALSQAALDIFGMSIDVQALLRSVRRSLLHAVDTGREHDLYEGYVRLFGYPCDKANGDDPNLRAYYCCPQGIVTGEWTFKRRELDRLHDDDYREPGVDQQQAPREDPGHDGDEDGGDNVADDGQIADVSLRPQSARLRGMFLFFILSLMSMTERPVLFTAMKTRDPPQPGPAESISAVLPSSTVSSAIATSTDSSLEVPVERIRIPDFRLVMAYLDDDDSETVRYDIALVEVKICTRRDLDDAALRNLSYRDVIELALDNMFPQILQAVQISFQGNTQDEICAISVVNDYCQFAHFRRQDLPKLNIVDLRKPPPTKLSKKELTKLKKLSHQRSATIQIINGVQDTISRTRKLGRKRC